MAVWLGCYSFPQPFFPYGNRQGICVSVEAQGTDSISYLGKTLGSGITYRGEKFPPFDSRVQGKLAWILRFLGTQNKLGLFNTRKFIHNCSRISCSLSLFEELRNVQALLTNVGYIKLNRWKVWQTCNPGLQYYYIYDIFPRWTESACDFSLDSSRNLKLQNYQITVNILTGIVCILSFELFRSLLRNFSSWLNKNFTERMVWLSWPIASLKTTIIIKRQVYMHNLAYRGSCMAGGSV